MTSPSVPVESREQPRLPERWEVPREHRWAMCLYPTYPPEQVLAEEWSRKVIERAMALSDTEDDENHEYDGWDDDL